MTVHTENEMLSHTESRLPRRLLSEHWPLWIGLAALWISTGVLQYLASQKTDGHLIYTLDDGYIHMAMAKNLALHGVYGVTQYEFSSSSSSPVWTLLEALWYSIFGVHEWIPFVLNLVISSLILAATYVLLERFWSKRILLMIVLLAVVFFTPLPLLISTGMEHPLHILFAIPFLLIASEVTTVDRISRRPWSLPVLCLLGAMMVMTRFESYALIFIVCLLFVLRGRWKIALLLFLSSIVPLVGYQAVSVAHGWQWLPNSILIRTDTAGTEMFNSLQSFVLVPRTLGHFTSFVTVAWTNVLNAPYVAVLIGTSLVVLILSWKKSGQFWKYEHVALLSYVLMALAHMQFGKIGFFFRYDAYLVAVGIVVVAIPALSHVDEMKNWMTSSVSRAIGGSIALLIALQLSIPLFVRAFDSLPLVPRASKNIYEQQYQMGLFLHRYYDKQVVAANDIGAICYLSDVHLLDIVGLASADIYRLKAEHAFCFDSVQQICKKQGVSIAVAYETWLYRGGANGYQRSWKLAAKWKIPDNVVCGSELVSFFAVQPPEESRLIGNVRSFSATLPADVIYWTKPVSTEASSQP